MTYNPAARKRLTELLEPSFRIELADKHVESYEMACLITGHVPRGSYTAFGSFLSGFDAAMKLRFDELIEENASLHNRIFDDAMEKVKQEFPDNQENQE